MEVHHQTHTERKKWHHYFWEFLMLFLAVFCGFLTENFRERLMEKQRSKEFASNLLFDLSKDTSRINYINKYEDWKETCFDTLIILLSGVKNEFNAAQFYQKLRALDSWIATTNYSNTYDDLKTSGLIRYYTDNGLADKLKSYYTNYLLLIEQEKEAEQFYKQTCEPFLDQHFEGLKYINAINSRPEANKYLFNIPTDEKIEIANDIRKNMLNIVVRLKYKKGRFKSIELYKKQKQKAIELIKILKEEYHLK